MRPSSFQVLIPLFFAATISARVIPAWMLTPPNSLNVERNLDDSTIIRNADDSTIIRSVDESTIIRSVESTVDRRENIEIIEMR